MPESFRSPRPRAAACLFLPAASAAALALMLAGCGGDGAGAAGPGGAGQGASAGAKARFDPALRDAPCSVVTADTVGSVFGLPVDEIEQYAAMGMCQYNWKGDGQVMDATVHVARVSDDAAGAAKYFASTTAGISGADLDQAMDSIRGNAREKMEGDGGATDALLGAAGEASSSGSRGIQFRDVVGIGDQARMQEGRGDLSVLHGNLHFSVTAYHGDRMPLPDNLQEMVAASRAWQQTTLPQREKQTIQLAKAALAAL